MSAGDNCCFSHGVHEQLLHPSKFRTAMCKRAGCCDRDTCFFAHFPAELRSPECEPFAHTTVMASNLLVRICFTCR